MFCVSLLFCCTVFASFLNNSSTSFLKLTCELMLRKLDKWSEAFLSSPSYFSVDESNLHFSIEIPSPHKKKFFTVNNIDFIIRLISWLIFTCFKIFFCFLDNWFDFFFFSFFRWHWIIKCNWQKKYFPGFWIFSYLITFEIPRLFLPNKISKLSPLEWFLN